jgi:F0F1-type ATP synthase assembly protein I
MRTTQQQERERTTTWIITIAVAIIGGFLVGLVAGINLEQYLK